jgi:mannonate dehydratase
MRHTPETDASLPPRLSASTDGYLRVPATTPGHGVDIDEAEAAKYPYSPAYLPVARLEDGTMFNW